MADRSLLGVFAHPDDETSCSAALMKRYVAEGVYIHVITATRGEMGGLGTNGVVIKREDLPKVREAEQKNVFEHLGLINPPIYLDYRDQEVADADPEEVILKVLDVMKRVRPDVVLAFGPTGLSNHPDHIAMHHAAIEAFERYRTETDARSRLYYWALSPDILKEFELDIDGIETEPNVVLDVSHTWDSKVQCLRLYSSQADAQEIATWMEATTDKTELFHQVYPPLPAGVTHDDLFHS